LFTSNFIGIAFARSLHYQFYCWYFHTIFYLCTKAGFHWVLRLALSAGVEVAFNVFPATGESSMLLQACHAIMLIGLLLADLPAAFLPSTKRKVS
jgi:alpha-1,3-mannosyltransferase